MKIGIKQLLFAMFCIVVLVWIFWPTTGWTISEVIDGNTVVLNNGVTVNLIGVSSSEESRKVLEEYKTGKDKFKLQPDKSDYYLESKLKPYDVVSAYLLKIDGNYFDCINAMLLMEGKSSLEEGPFLQDSLNAFKQYALIASNNHTIPEPTPTPVAKIDYAQDNIILPPPPAFENDNRQSRWDIDGSMNVDMLEESCDYTLPYTHTFAVALATRAGDDDGPLGQICEIFDYCRNKWTYVYDPVGQEYLARASETIAGSAAGVNGTLGGDCDDFAVLLASCVLAIGGEVCINTGFNALQGGHAFTEVEISKYGGLETAREIIQKKFPECNTGNLHTRIDANNRVWLNLDWSARHPGGEYYNCSNGRNIYPCLNGRWSWYKYN